jgi:exosortase
MNLRMLIASMTDTKRPVTPWLAVLVGGWLWWLLIRHLALEWHSNPQYAYGWLMPLLCGYLLFRRWISRPVPDAPPRGLFWLAGLLAVALLPTRVVEEANPDWHLVSWVLAVQVTGLTLGVIAWTGGTNWLRHFAFPVLFILAAVPWPDAAALAVTQSLMRMVAALAAEMMNLIGIPAVQSGNLIETATGSVGIDAACSGVRSIQGMLMASLFLGELNRYRWNYRLLLVVAGIVLAFLLNVVRASFLAFMTVHGGVEAFDNWHDPAGLMILVFSFLALLVVAKFWFPAPVGEPATNCDLRARPLHPGVVIGFGFWLVLTEGATEAWYRWHERRAAPSVEWAVAWPERNHLFEDMQIAPEALKILACDEWRAARWLEKNGARWLVYYLHWRPDSAGARLETRVHNPSVCLPAGGFVMERDLGVEPAKVHGVWLSLHTYVFSSKGRRFHVFYAVCEDKHRQADEVVGGEAWGRARRLQVVLRGERKIGYRVIEAATDAEGSTAEVRAQFRGLLADLILLPGSRNQNSRMPAESP